MTADALSQEEIDALLAGTQGTGGEVTGIRAGEREPLAQYQRAVAQALGEVLSGLLSVETTAEAEDLAEGTPESIGSYLRPPLVAVSVKYTKGLAGQTALFFSQPNAYEIVSQLMGGAEVTEFSDLEQSAFSEVGSQSMGAAHASLASSLGTEIATAPVTTVLCIDADSLMQALAPLGPRFGVLTYRLAGEELAGPVVQLVSNQLLGSLVSAQTAPRPGAGAEGAGRRARPEVAPVEFTELQPTPVEAPKSLDLILDIGLTVKVELGRARRQVRDIINLSQGAVIELDKLVGEPLDIIVNDQLFARGEVVVIDESFGVRVTEILSPKKRIEALKARSSQ